MAAGPGLTGRGTGLRGCSRRPGLPLTTAGRYARAAGPARMIRAPRYQAALAGPDRDHRRARRAAGPAGPVCRLLAEIRGQGYTASTTLPAAHHRRPGRGRPHLPPRRAARLLLTGPGALSDSQQALPGQLTGACPEMTSLAALVGSFAALLSPGPASQARLSRWAQAARAADLPNLHACTRGLERAPAL